MACGAGRRPPQESLAADWRGGTGVALPRLGETVAYVQSLLQTAIEVEHSTIPLYLTTAYSIVNQSSFEATTMLGVVMEEMLHMVNAANVLNAIGGAPSLDHPDFIPTYPLVMPFLNMSADVVWFTKESVQHYQILESTPPGGYVRYYVPAPRLDRDLPCVSAWCAALTRYSGA